MQTTTTYYRVVVSDPAAWDMAGYDALYGRQPRVFRDREDAEAHAKSLAEAWPEDDRPEYEVEEIDAETAAETAFGIAGEKEATRRVQYAVYDTREAALADGWPDAEYGCWQSSPSSTRLVRGWIALEYDEPDDDEE